MIWKDKFPKENIYFQVDDGILYHADCLKIIGKFPEGIFDAIITDLPYGITACKWDAIIPFNEMWKEIKKIRKDNTPIILFGHEPFSSLLRISNLEEYKYDWYWNKVVASNFLNAKKQPLRNIENIIVFYKKQPTYNPQITYGFPRKISSAKNRRITANRFNETDDKLYSKFYPDGLNDYNSTKRFPKVLLTFSTDKQKEHYHPTQKPVALLKYLIETYTKENDLVLDFTCGSGTTLIACEELNRKWIGIEIERKYCEIAKKRILKVINKKKLKLF